MTIIRRTVVGASTLGLIASLLTGAFANGAELPKRSVLTLEAAQRVVQAAKKEATDHSWACVIAVVDDEGLLVTMVRMDNAAVPAGVELAPGKARTAALFRRPTSALEEAINGPRPAAITAAAAAVAGLSAIVVAIQMRPARDRLSSQNSVAGEEEDRSVSKPIVSAASVRAAPLVFDAARTPDATAEGTEREEPCSA